MSVSEDIRVQRTWQEERDALEKGQVNHVLGGMVHFIGVLEVFIATMATTILILLLYFNIHEWYVVCVSVYVCVCIHLSVGMHVITHVLVPENMVIVPSLLSFHLFLCFANYS